MAKILLEVPVFSVEAAFQAVKAGADRLELCADFGEGGVTPSAGTISVLKEKIHVPIYAMIRPRGGDFLYTTRELKVMIRDIQILSDLGIDGFVFGALNADGAVDKIACSQLVAASEGRPCTFHRAFDVCRSQEDSLEEIIALGFQKILTSGGFNTVSDGLDNILRILHRAGDQISIMPGGGLKPVHINLLKKAGNLREVHASCKAFRKMSLGFQHPEVILSNNPETFYQRLVIDEILVKEFQAVLK